MGAGWSLPEGLFTASTVPTELANVLPSLPVIREGETRPLSSSPERYQLT